MEQRDSHDAELLRIATQAGLLPEASALPEPLRDFALNLVRHCADLADRRDPSVQPGRAIREAFGLRERRAIGRRPSAQAPADTATAAPAPRKSASKSA